MVRRSSFAELEDTTPSVSEEEIVRKRTVRMRKQFNQKQDRRRKMRIS